MSGSSHLAVGELVPPSCIENKFSNPVLQRFSRLDRFSQEFPEHLLDLLSGKDYVECVSGLEGNDLLWFVEYLDQV